MLVAFIGVALVTLVVNLASISIVQTALYSQVDTILTADANAVLAVSSPANPSLGLQIQDYASVIGAISVRAPWLVRPSVVGALPARQLLRSHYFVNGATTSDGWRVVTVSNSKGVIVSVAQSTRDLSASSTALSLEEAVSTFIAMALLVILALWVLLNGVRPLSAITRVVAEMDSGALDKRIEITDKMLGTEFGALAHSFNAMLDDLLERSTREAALSAQLRQFVADAGHELRTPLTVISGYTQVLEASSDDPNRRQEALNRMTSEVSRMSRVVEDLLALARLEARSDLRYESVDLIALVRDLIDDHSTLDTTADHPVSLAGPTELFVALDVDLISRVVVNLLANLRLHTPLGTSAKFIVRSTENNVELIYEDNGPGVSDPVKVFTRFWQENSNRNSTGTGLGMAIAAAAISAHGGTIVAENIDPHGLRIRASLPVDG